jgi:hypothetical protein
LVLSDEGPVELGEPAVDEPDADESDADERDADEPERVLETELSVEGVFAVDGVVCVVSLEVRRTEIESEANLGVVDVAKCSTARGVPNPGLPRDCSTLR